MVGIVNKKDLLLISIFLLILQTTSITIPSTQYNKQWSYTLNRLSRITHQPRQKIQSWSCKLCQQGQQLLSPLYIENQLTNVVGYMGYMQSKNSILLLMRGTVDIKNWIEDFSYRFVGYGACKGCLIHEGFYLDYLSVAGKVREGVRSIMEKYQNARLIVVGSSLGAALATVAAIQLQLQLGTVDQLHTFGCPRVGNANLAQFLTIKLPELYRVIHNRDIVPHVPLLQQNYRHPPFEILFDQKMQNYKVCDQSGEDPTCSNAYSPNYSIPDHTSYWF